MCRAQEAQALRRGRWRMRSSWGERRTPREGAGLGAPHSLPLPQCPFHTAFTTSSHAPQSVTSGRQMSPRDRKRDMQADRLSTLSLFVTLSMLFEATCFQRSCYQSGQVPNPQKSRIKISKSATTQATVIYSSPIIQLALIRASH